MTVRSAAEMAALRAVDSPTLSNAIERCGVRPRIAGYAGSICAVRSPGWER